MLVKLGAGHRRHMNVCDQAIGFAEMRRREEIGCRRERFDTVAPRPHKPSQGVAKEPVILDDRDQSRFGHTVSNTSIEPAIPATLLAVVPVSEFDNRNLRPRVPLGNANAHKFWFRRRPELRYSAPGIQPNPGYLACKLWSMPLKSHGAKDCYSRPQIGNTRRTARPLRTSGRRQRIISVIF